MRGRLQLQAGNCGRRRRFAIDATEPIGRPSRLLIRRDRLLHTRPRLHDGKRFRGQGGIRDRQRLRRGMRG